MLVISDTNVSYDSDKLPGAYFAPGLTGDLTGLNVEAEADIITANEPDVRGARFIGQSGSVFDNAPTAKDVGSLGRIRGLAPEEPTKQGSYYAAAVAAYGKRADLRPDLDKQQSVDTFVVALASPLPRIEVPMSSGARITLVPFAKSVYRDAVQGAQIDRAKGSFQPTNQIVDFYVDTLANSGPKDRNAQINSGRYYAKFRISFEDVEQGGDHDMDAVAEYEVAEGENNMLVVKVRVIYEAGRVNQRIGYVVSGTDKDGIYLEVQDDLPPLDKTKPPLELPYFLDTPKDLEPGACDNSPLPAACKQPLPYFNSDEPKSAAAIATRIFRPGRKPAATLLKDPLWYAAKWGGFIDRNDNGKPDRELEWDLNADKVPDSYNLVLNPTRLREALRATFENIAGRTSSASNVSINSTEVTADAKVFQATFNSKNWSGDLVARPITSSGLGSAISWQASLAGPSWTDRKLFLQTGTGKTTSLNNFNELSTDDRGLLKDADVYEYLRGDHSREIRNSGKLRDRVARLGDIVHSSPYYDKPANTLYVGANDGMLHAFNGENGAELFAFIPRAAIAPRTLDSPPPLPQLADPSYKHAYFVDGDITVASSSNLTGNKRYLYALMGRGARGLFSLDVTTPHSFSEDAFRWEYTSAAAGTKQGDPAGAAATDQHLGYMLGRPVLATLNTGQLGLIVGNGYSSPGQSAVLYIFIINPDGSLSSVRTLDTGVAGENGLAGPAVVDTNNDGKADLVFAGDLKGNVWKFDIGASTPGNWAVAHQGKPLFTATGPDGGAQPITAPMFAAYKPAKGNKDKEHAGQLFVFFGTGAYFRAGDVTSSAVQTWWGVLGDKGPISGRKALKKRSVSEVGKTSKGRPARTFTPAVDGDMAGSSGWYIDFTAPQPGERIVTASKMVDLVVPVLLASSFYPVTDQPCEPGGKGYLNVVDPFTGGGIEVGVLDADRDGSTEDDKLGSRFIGSVDVDIGMPTEAHVITGEKGVVQIIVGGSGGSAGTISSLQAEGPPGQKKAKYQGRLSWREIVKE
jgi:type IV pilus assembly protein PilY1